MVVLIGLASCSPQPVTPSDTPLPVTPAIANTSPITATASPTTVPAPTAAVELTATPVPAPAASQVCSPLQGIALDQLDEIVSNPFDQPSPGSDAGHHGVDLGFYSFGPFKQMAGLPVTSVLDGTVAAVVADRKPYGNALIIETTWDQIPVGWKSGLEAVLPLVETPAVHLTCPTPSAPLDVDRSSYSLYLLYAHLQNPVSLAPGDPVACGDTVGQVGHTGAAVNDHLHLEFRLGYSGARFGGMAHYTNDASLDEMATYCTWRVGGLFKLLDPLPFLDGTSG